MSLTATPVVEDDNSSELEDGFMLFNDHLHRLIAERLGISVRQR